MPRGQVRGIISIGDRALERSRVMSSSQTQTTGDVCPDGKQFVHIRCLNRTCSRCAHFLRSSAFNRARFGLVKNATWEDSRIRTGVIGQIPLRSNPQPEDLT